MVTGASLRRRVQITNKDGLNLLAAAALSRQAREFPCSIGVRYADRRANGKEIFDLICLGAPLGSMLEFEAQGPQSLLAITTLAALVERHFHPLQPDPSRELR